MLVAYQILGLFILSLKRALWFQMLRLFWIVKRSRVAWNIIISSEYLNTSMALCVGDKPPVASFAMEVKSRLAKRPLVFNGRLANRRLTSVGHRALEICCVRFASISWYVITLYMISYSSVFRECECMHILLAYMHMLPCSLCMFLYPIGQ